LITINRPLDVVKPPQKLEMTDFMEKDVKFTL